MRAFWSLVALLVVGTVVAFLVRGSEGEALGTRHLARGGEDSAVGDADREAPQSLNGSIPDSLENIENPLARRERTDHEHRGGAPTGFDGDFMGMLFGKGDKDATAEVTAEQRAMDEASKQAQIVRLDASSIELDERFTVRGKGSPEDPYVIPWELLVSAREVYVPKEERRVIPGRIDMFQGAWVEITGYIMLPTMRDRVREFVVMESEWDGCCIGIPPTPYDSVEVTLAEARDFSLSGQQYATVRGRMVVDPYLFGNRMLIGLYAIEDATIRVTEF